MPRRRLINLASRMWPKTGFLSTGLGKRVVLGSVVVLLAALPLAVRVVPLGLEAGQPAPRTYRAPRTVQWVDQDATAALRQTAAEAVAPIYVFDEAAKSRTRKDIVEFFASASASEESSLTVDPAARAAFLAERYGSRVDSATIEAVIALPPASMETVSRTVEGLVSSILSARIQERDLAAAQAQLAQSAELIPLTVAERYAVIAVGTAFLEPTVTVDEAATQRSRLAASEAVSPVVVVVQQGQNIVEKGDVVTARDLDLVRSLGGLDQGIDRSAIAASILLMTALILAAGAYFYAYDQWVWRRLRNLILLSALLVGMMYATRLITLLVPEASPYLLPMPLAAVLATLLVGARPAVILALITTVAGLLLGFSGGAQVVALLVADLVAIAVLSHLKKRSHLFYAGVGLVGLLGTVSFTTSLASGARLSQAAIEGAQGLGGGLATAVLMLGLLPFLEFAFGVTTDVTLLELGNPGHPLLKRLMVEAPGTYAHSVMTANLAETAAEAIGANPLLARVGAYFHDVGKVVRPAFYVENQAGGENPHDYTAPTLSARIIVAHVREGVQLAEEHGLPAEVVDIIRQHHGTSVVGYFYNKASLRGGAVMEADFRYDGRRPSTREAALVMIADIAEAGVRSLAKAEPEAIEALIRRLVRGKVDDHQLDETSLTLSDLETIITVYTRMLSSIYHPRVEYPEPQEERIADGDQYRQPQGA